jgi:membrane protease YdiL (CAAX protease family)
MERFDLVFEPEKSLWQKRIQALFEVFLLSGIVSAILAYLPFVWSGRTQDQLLNSAFQLTGFLLLESAIALCLLLFILQFHRETLHDLGLVWSQWKPNLLAGILLTPLLYAVNALISILFDNYLPQYASAKNPILETIRSPVDLILFLVAAVFVGGIKEELQRAFILIRFRAGLGGARVGLIIWSFGFGIGHYTQGVQATVTAGLFGFIFGVIYLARRNLLAPMLAHTLYDVSVLLGFWFFKGPA